MPQGVSTPLDVKNEVRMWLFSNDNMTGKDLKEKVDKECGIELTERTYQNIKNEVLPAVLKTKNGIKEKPFSLGILSRYNGTPQILPDAIPHILAVQMFLPLVDDEFSKVYKPESDSSEMRLSLRQARWCGFLYTYIDGTNNPKDLWLASYVYSVFERGCELNDDMPCDTSWLDEKLRSDGWQKWFTRWLLTYVGRFYPDNTKGDR